MNKVILIVLLLVSLSACQKDVTDVVGQCFMHKVSGVKGLITAKYELFDEEKVSVSELNKGSYCHMNIDATTHCDDWTRYLPGQYYLSEIYITSCDGIILPDPKQNITDIRDEAK